MNDTIPLPAVNEFVARYVADVFDTMLSLPLAPRPDATLPHHVERVSGSVGFAGGRVTGALYLHLSAAFATAAAAKMLGLPPDQRPGEADANDLVGELTNMLTGGLKSWLSDGGLSCAMSTPAIIRGVKFSIEPAQDVERRTLVYDCRGEIVVVELHLKLN